MAKPRHGAMPPAPARVEGGWRPAGGIGLRVLAGVGGGYGVAALFTLVLTEGLPLPRAEAVVTATLPSFAIHAAAILWAFAARGVARAWAGMALVAAALVGLLLLFQEGIA